ncbi:hypothetical protein [Saccharothrix coeruleofusca]|uniref:Uncharacterized protein n=1 Tax=Saccharothrix coeruleofusca TaxID=33919 RepID=A0A918AFV8_9PSEU|nr:hypothetical protein [Saccharothrix coeruleofusca]MBP2340226.1 hypothetical protein [Saccharothrix coeruleofusca]GGP36685.1 hypothetical protein GCM10010185_04800 [Saccharothrix coeruleofusca]
MGWQVAWALGAQLIAVAGLVARLRWWAVRERRRQEALRAFAARLPAAGDVEIDDVRGDGSRLRVRIRRDR